MIDNEILDQVIPVPDLMELKDQKIQELADEGFSITNFHSGGVFYTLMLILLRIQIELLELGRTILNQMFVSHATGVWLDLKMADYSKSRKQAQKAQGTVTVSRTEMDGEAIKIPRGHIFKSIKDINGDELRFIVLEAQITRTLTYLGEVTITNERDWLTREGSDTEDDESARERTLRSWSELALVPLRDTYINVCSAIAGVLYVTVKDQHPRGQGTVDIIITSEAGTATEELLELCRTACEEIREPDTDIQVKSAEVVTQDIAVTVTVSSSLSQDGLVARVETAVNDLLTLRNRNVALNELTHADIIHKIKSDVSVVRNVTVTTPAADVTLDVEKVIMAGKITVTVKGV